MPPYDHTVKRTYNLPSEAISAMEQAVEPGKRSAFIGGLIQEWLSRERKSKLRKEIIEGCRAMAQENLEIETAFHAAEEELER